jgi:hypothetical protein
MHGICFDYELQEWFEFKILKTKKIRYIFNALEVDDFNIKSAAKIVFRWKAFGGLQNLKRKLLGYDELDFPR